jgi:Domain of unknown function (DUF4402)
VRSRSRRRVLAAALLVSVACAGTAGRAATKVVQISAKPVKPLTLSRVEDLDLGSIVLGPGTWSNATVSISRAGTFSCTSANVTCSGTTRAATYSVSGSNNEVVRITAPNVTMTSQADPSQTLTLIVDSPAAVTLDTGGKKGTDFSIGGSINVSSTTAGGTYAGTFNVTVDY